MSDCQYGVVFDGLQSLFTASISNAANIVLRTINNRKYIFAVTLKFDKEKLKVIEEKRKEEKGKRYVYGLRPGLTWMCFRIVPFSYRSVFISIHFGLLIQMFASS